MVNEISNEELTEKRFKSCVLQGLFVLIKGSEVTTEYRDAVAGNILALLRDLQADQMQKLSVKLNPDKISNLDPVK